MFTPKQYRAKAAQYTQLLKTTRSPAETREFRKLEQSYITLAENDEWLAENREKTHGQSTPDNWYSRKAWRARSLQRASCFCTRMIDLEVVTFEIERAEDIAPVFAELKDRAEALYVCIDTILFSDQTRINTLARDARLPTMQSNRASVEAGALMSYGPNFLDLFRRAADYVDKILRGAKPGDIPVEQPTKFDLVINLNTAKALGLTIPESFLLRADEVIE